jgi:DNA-binding response OmpR family regulator
MQNAPHILVVDDDTEIRLLLERYLNEQGFRVSVAASRQEFETQLAARNPDLIVLDVLLPDGSGLGLAIAKEIIERFGGTITVANRKPAGLLQTVSFKTR